MSKERGLFNKYQVRRSDGRDISGDRQNAAYFVLDYAHDPLARTALRVYVNAARAHGYEELAKDLEIALENTADFHDRHISV